MNGHLTIASMADGTERYSKAEIELEEINGRVDVSWCQFVSWPDAFRMAFLCYNCQNNLVEIFFVLRLFPMGLQNPVCIYVFNDRKKC